MPWAGYPRPIAPNLTAFAARAVQYTHAYSLSSYTSQSVAGMLASRLPSELRRDGQFFNRWHRDAVFFPELLAAAGVRTLAAHTHFYFRRGFAGFDQGFDVYEMLPGGHVDYTTDLDVTSDRHEALAERLLADDANTRGRFFAWFHFTDPHDRYLPHPGVGPYGRRLRDLYDAEVTFTDQWVGRLLAFVERQPWGRETAVIVTADHGEAFGEHHMTRHAFELWQPLVRVPLLVLLPGAPPRTIEQSRSHADLAPTILELLGVQPAPEMRGTSLLAEAYGEAQPAERDVWIDHAQTTVSGRRRALVHGRHKVIAFDDDARFMVFDLAADPDEARSLRETDRATYDAMVARYRATQSGFHDVVAPAVAARARR
jgi:choline-sulfatase